MIIKTTSCMCVTTDQPQ